MLVSSFIYSQNSVIELEKSDSVKHNKILIVPLNPKLYFSDADHVLEEWKTELSRLTRNIEDNKRKAKNYREDWG